MSKQEWAIRDEATGEWWDGTAQWVRDTSRAQVFDTYPWACASGAWDGRHRRETARIVSPPPREMSEKECWAWLKEWNESSRQNGGLLFLCPYRKWQVEELHKDGDEKWFEVHGSGLAPCDAIRAARRKLESK